MHNMSNYMQNMHNMGNRFQYAEYALPKLLMRHRRQVRALPPVVPENWTRKPGPLAQ